MQSILSNQAIIIASFGSVDSKVRSQTIEALFIDIKSAFKNFEVRQAYTSNFIRRKLKLQGIEILSIEEQIEALKTEGIEKIIILPTHLTPGEEFENKILPFEDENIIVLPPLFSISADTEFDKFSFNTILNCFKVLDNEELVLIGHGSPHRHNPVYENLQNLADSKNLKIHIGVIEPSDTPNFDDVFKRLQKNKATDILIAPLLFNGGTHISSDIAGDSDSWKSRLLEKGFHIRICTDGLGSFENFRQLYIKRLMNWLDKNF